MTGTKMDSRVVDSISAASAGTLPGLFKKRVEGSPDKPAYMQFDAGNNSWQTYSWQEMGILVSRWQQGLKGEGLEPGERVGILCANSVEWVCFEQASLGLGLVVVPLYTWDSPANIAYLLQDSGCRLLLAGTEEQWQKLVPRTPSLSQLEKVICLEEYAGEAGDISVVPLSRWLPGESTVLQTLVSDPDSLATIVYTSGTTGPPKGVMLSHKNILWNAEAILRVIPVYTSDLLLSFLPLSHTFERTVGYYTPMMAGCTIAYCRSMEKLAEDLRTVRPTIIISVPRIFEKVYGKISLQLEGKGGLARYLFQRTLAVGHRRFEASQGRGKDLSPGDKLLWPLLQHLVAGKILGRLGGRIRFAVSGGAPLQEEVSRFFLSIGLDLIQGYGLTEAAPVVSTNTPDHNVPASVGPPLPDVSCKVTGEGELLVKSPGLMAGYWNLAEQTGEAIDPEGWLHTGDLVEMSDGDIHIRGRLKEIIVTSTGEKVPPADMEMTLSADPMVGQVMVIGEGMPYIAALLVLESSAWVELAASFGLDPTDELSLKAVVVKQAILDRFERLLDDFPGNARIRTVALLQDEWSIDNGLLTPTLKLKRGAIERRYAETIRELYRGHAMVG